MTAPQTFTDWLEARLGTRRWVVAPHLTDRLKRKGYTLALPQKRFSSLYAEYNREQANAKAERVTRALFPDDYHDGTDCRAEIDRVNEPCRVCADNLERWRNRIREVTAALTAEGLLP